jgi:hypothetical protein
MLPDLLWHLEISDIMWLLEKNDELEQLLYQAIVELAYVQESPDHSLCASAKGKEIIERGTKLLGVEDLSRSGNCADIRRAANSAA